MIALRVMGSMVTDFPLDVSIAVLIMTIGCLSFIIYILRLANLEMKETKQR